LLVFVVLMILSLGIAYWMTTAEMSVTWIVAELMVLNLAGAYILAAFKIANQWEKAIVLRLGRFVGLKGPGPFWIVPIVDTVAMWIDHRVMVTPFTAERTLTKDTVPVDVDAVLFWLVWDAEKAALEVEDYRGAIAWAADSAARSSGR
jgi:regulator of protease activity HflC (stomatin/prohibitin superfamily)